MSTVTRTHQSTTASVHSRAVTIAVVLLSAPAMVWGTILLVSVTADDPGLGGLAGSGIAEALGLASVIGLIGAAGAAIVSRVAGGGPARASAETTTDTTSSRGIAVTDAPPAWFEERSGRRGPAALIAATAVAGGMVIAAVTGQLAFGTAQPGTPLDSPATPTNVVGPTEEPASEQAIIFGDHTDH